MTPEKDEFPEYPWEPEPLDPELARLLAWFIKNREGRLAWRKGFSKLCIVSAKPKDPHDHEYVIKGIK